MAIFLATIFTSSGTVRKEGCFNQLGSIHRETLCIQNLLDRQFPDIKKKVKQWNIMAGMFFQSKNKANKGGGLCLLAPTGIISLPNGLTLTVERINMNDRRYKNSAIVSEYRNFFSARSINELLNDNGITPATAKVYRQTKLTVSNNVLSKAGITTFTFVATMF